MGQAEICNMCLHICFSLYVHVQGLNKLMGDLATYSYTDPPILHRLVLDVVPLS